MQFVFVTAINLKGSMHQIWLLLLINVEVTQSAENCVLYCKSDNIRQATNTEGRNGAVVVYGSTCLLQGPQSEYSTATTTTATTGTNIPAL